MASNHLHVDQMEPFEFKNVRLIYCNFEGRKGPYNAEGTRSFAVVLYEKDRDALVKEGWNVKEMRGSGERDSYLPITIPKDIPVWVKDITKQMNVKVLGYRWNIGSKTGVKAYLEHIEEAD